jgi:hypothetical protein
MSYDKEDFIVMTNSAGAEIVVNISKINFIVSGVGGHCRLYFGGGEDDYISVKYNIDDFMEIL